MKKVAYADLKYSIRILKNEDEGYSVEVPKLPGCYSFGKTKNECIANAVEAIELHLENIKRPPIEDSMPAIEVIEEAPKPFDFLISLPEACKLLDISDSTLRRYIKEDKIPSYNFGKEYKFKIQELLQFIDSARTKPRKPVRPRPTQRVG